MIGGNQSNWVVGLGLALFALLLFMVWFGHYYDFADVCGESKDENIATCAREWIGAAGGYVATLFAAFTIYFLHQQNKEMRKQTEFIVGDAPPTIDVLEHIEDAEELVVRVVNWNRRPVMIHSLVVRGVEGTTYVEGGQIDGESLGMKDWARGVWPIVIRGYEEKNQRPHYGTFDVAVVTPDGAVQIKDWGKATVVADIQIVGASHERRILVGDVHPKA